MPSIERSFHLLNTRTQCVIFLYNCSVLMALVFYYKDMLEKGKRCKEPSNFRLLFVTERTRHSGKMTAHASSRLRDFRARRNGRHRNKLRQNGGNLEIPANVLFLPRLRSSQIC